MALSEEKIAEIQKQLQGLSPEEQQKKVQEILATLSPEEREELTGGPQECPFCSMVAGQIQVKKVYEDDRVMAILDINPANKGHTLLFPKTHVQFSAQMSNEDFGYVIVVANKLAASIFESLKAEGTNILVQNGPIAGQTAPHFLVHVIPRYKEDGVVLAWKPKKFSDKETADAESAVKKGASSINMKPTKVVKQEIE